MASGYLDFPKTAPKSKWMVLFTITSIAEVFYMLRDWQSHEEYQKNLLLNLVLFYQTDRERVVELSESISKLYLLNLDKLHPIIKPLYSNTGRPAKNQAGIIRSFILMLDQGEHDIPKWAAKVASDRLLCAICGFTFGDAPDFSSYYDLTKRLWQASHKAHIERKKKLRSFYSKPRKKLKQGKKYVLPKHNGVVKKFASLAILDKLPQYRPEIVLQKFLARCVVDTSLEMGILGDPKNFSIANDGTPYYSGASHYGVKVCDCKSKGIFDCKCPRRYSDPDATWGWDSYREQWFYGDTLFCVTASDSPYDLPICLRKAQAQRHDSIIAIFALDEVRKLFPDICFKNYIADGAMDNYPTYRLLQHYGMIPFIPLDSNVKYPYKDLPPGILCFDNDGNPICMGGIPYQKCGYSYPKGIKCRCWFDYYGIEKPCSCTDSPYGRTVYIKPDFDPRLFPPVLRDTNAFKEMFKRRTTVERSHKRLFKDYDIEAGNCRSSRERFMRSTMAAVNVHLDAWISHTGFSIIDLIEKCFNTAA